MKGCAPNRVFVYGTLRRGATQSGRMGAARWLGEGVVKGGMFRVSWYPGVVLSKQGGRVVGDVFEVSCDLLEKLDEYEGCEYRRVVVQVEGTASGDAWMWEWAHELPQPACWIDDGDWLRQAGD